MANLEFCFVERWSLLCESCLLFIMAEEEPINASDFTQTTFRFLYMLMKALMVGGNFEISFHYLFYVFRYTLCTVVDGLSKILVPLNSKHKDCQVICSLIRSKSHSDFETDNWLLETVLMFWHLFGT